MHHACFAFAFALQLGDVPEDGKLDDLLDERGACKGIEAGTLELEMDGYGFRWFGSTPPTSTPRRSSGS